MVTAEAMAVVEKAAVMAAAVKAGEREAVMAEAVKVAVKEAAATGKAVRVVAGKEVAGALRAAWTAAWADSNRTRRGRRDGVAGREATHQRGVAGREATHQ